MVQAPRPLCRITWVGGVSTLCHQRHLTDYWTDALKDRVERFADSVWEIHGGLPRLLGLASDGSWVLLAQVVGEARGTFAVQVVVKGAHS